MFSKVTIIAGFLGSGKTTMIERIIKLPELEKRIAIIQNEFSQDMGIGKFPSPNNAIFYLEAPLMTNSQGEVLDEFYEMPNGCI